MLLGLILVSYLIPYFLLRKFKPKKLNIFKKHKNKSLANITLPHKKDMKKIFKLFREYKNISCIILMNELNYTKIEADHYINLLKTKNYITLYEQPWFYNFIALYYFISNDFYYSITDIGREYAVKNNLA